MTRVITDDLFLNFSLTDDDIPTTTNAEGLITALYKKAYSIVYGTGKYSADDSTDTETIVTSDDVFAVIQAAASRILNGWYDSGLIKQATEIKPVPKFDFIPEERNEIKDICRRARGRTSTVRLWNNASDY